MKLFVSNDVGKYAIICRVYNALDAFVFFFFSFCPEYFEATDFYDNDKSASGTVGVQRKGNVRKLLMIFIFVGAKR